MTAPQEGATVPAKKSCATCPSFLTTLDTVGAFRKSIGSPMCARFGIVLGRPGFDSKEEAGLQTHIATNLCKKWGEPKPANPVHFSPRVTQPIEDGQWKEGEPHGAVPVTSCTMCANFLPDREVSERWGWASGLCQLKGTLVLPHMTGETARTCDVSSYGTPAPQPVELIPWYDSSYYHVDLFASYGSGVVHPLMHPTDAPVTDDDTKGGILAWRKIINPDNEDQFVMLPIYDPKQFSRDQVAKIPQPGDDEHPELYLDHGNNVYTVAVCWRELDETPMAWGSAGIGKTEIARHLAYLMQLPFERFQITATSELDELAGKMLFGVEPTDTPGTAAHTYFQFGRVAKAWAQPCVILIDEPNAGPSEVWQFLRPLTDNSKELVLDAASGQRVTRSLHTYMMMAANPSWDPLNVGALTIGDADASRLQHIRFTLPPRDLEMKIIAARVALDSWKISKGQLTYVMDVADTLRELCADATLPMTWGIRNQIKVARALKWFSPVKAYRLASDDLEPGVQQLILEAVKAVFGDSDV